MRAECIQSVSQAIGRALTQVEVKGIEERLVRNLRQMAREEPQRVAAMPEAQRLQEAAKRSADELQQEATLKKVRTALTIVAHDRVANYVADAKKRGINNFDALRHIIAFDAGGKSSFLSIESRTNAIKADALRRMVETFDAIDGKFWRFFTNPEAERVLLREMFGQDTGNAAAKAGAKAWLEVAELLRQRFNAAGGDVGKLENWSLPQHHAQVKVAKAGRDAWVNDVLPLLDRSQYVKEDGSRMNDAELVDLLRNAWQTIATGGVNKLEPGRPKGNGARSNRHSESRQIHFKGPDEYAAYQAKYGERSLYEVMVSHINGLSKDIALVETLGPNPNAVYNFFRDSALKAETEANPRKSGKMDEQATKLDNLYNFVAGRTLPIANEYLARSFDTLRNWMVASRLGSAVITSLSDAATVHLVAHVNNLPEMQVFKNQLAALNPANKTELRMARRAGLALESMIADLNRFGQEGLGASFSSKMASATMRASGMNALTDAQRRAFGVTMMDAIGALTRDVQSVKDLDAVDWRILKAKGITETDWKVWRLAKPEQWNGTNSTMLTPESIARVSDADLAKAGLSPRDRTEAVTKLLGTVLEEVDMAVIQPGARERAMMGGNLQRGTWKGELVKSFFLFKSFPVSMMMRHWMRGWGMETAGGKAAYIASLMAGTTILGAVSMQINELLMGRDPKNLNPFDGKAGVKNWVAAMMKGGSLGIYGDFLFSEATQGGRGMLATLQGPVFGLVEEGLNLTQGNLVQFAQGKDTRAGAELVRFVKGNTPGANLWYAKAALDHLVFHQLQEYFSPGYLRSMEARSRREFGQSYWWQPGDVAPERAPNLSTAIGE